MSLPHAGVDVATAAIAGIGGHWRDFYQTNVVGTRHVVEGCRQQGVGRPIYTSSPSVTFDAADQNGVTSARRPAVSRPLSAQQGDRSGKCSKPTAAACFLARSGRTLSGVREIGILFHDSSPEPEPGGCAASARGKTSST